MAKLRCGNPECESFVNNQHLFDIAVSVDEDGDLAENLKKIDSSYFTCNFCGGAALWVDMTSEKEDD